MSKHFENLKLQALAIGSLPHSKLENAIAVVEKSEIPFVPQLVNINKNEDMIFQFLEGLPSFSDSNKENFLFDIENEEFLSGLEEFLSDYEEITSDINSQNLDKYAISEKYSCAFGKFIQIIQNTKPQFAKCQIVGPFTLSAALKDKDGNPVIYDDTFREIIVKLLILKALWQIKQIKMANSDTIPIVFMDEPSVSQLGTSAYITIESDMVIHMIKTVSDAIQANGALSAIHCCGKCDWQMPLCSGVNIVNFDAFSFADNFTIYNKNIKIFLENGGKIAWGLVPTLNADILKSLDLQTLIVKFQNCIKNLTKNGINKKLIIDNSIVTTSCGTGSLNVNAAEKAMNLLYELSQKLREMF